MSTETEAPSVEYDPDPLYFPSQAWFAEYYRKINADDEYAEMSQDWGVDFNGDFIFKMTHMPIEEMDVDAMPEYLQEELDKYVKETDSEGYVGYAAFGLEGGECTDARLLEDPDTFDEGFMLTATTENWKALLSQEIGIIDGLMGGTFEIDGDMQKILQYSDSAVRLTELAADVDCEYADEAF